MTIPLGSSPDRDSRLAALVDVLRPWDRTGLGEVLASWAMHMDFVYRAAQDEADTERPKLSGAARRGVTKRVATFSGADLDLEPENATLSPADLHTVRRFQESVMTGALVPVTAEEEAAWSAAATKNRRPGKYTADAAMDFALATFSKLTGEAGSRVNAEGRTGRINEPTKRGGAALAFVRALDDFYGLSLATDVRLRESVLRQREARARQRQFRGE